MAKRQNHAQKMFGHVTRQRESGMSVANYAKQIGITPTKLQYWSRKFNAQEAIKAPAVKFIDLNSFGTDPDFVTAGEAPGIQKRNPQITVTLPNGVCVNIF